MGNIKETKREKNKMEKTTLRFETKKHGVKKFINTKEGFKELKKFIEILRKEENESINIKFKHIKHNGDQPYTDYVDDYNDIDKIERWIECVKFGAEVN